MGGASFHSVSNFFTHILFFFPLINCAENAHTGKTMFFYKSVFSIWPSKTAKISPCMGRKVYSVSSTYIGKISRTE